MNNLSSSCTHYLTSRAACIYIMWISTTPIHTDVYSPRSGWRRPGGRLHPQLPGELCPWSAPSLLWLQPPTLAPAWGREKTRKMMRTPTIPQHTDTSDTGFFLSVNSLLAVSTPGGEKLHQPDVVALHHHLVKVVICELHHVLAAAATALLEGSRVQLTYVHPKG